MAPPACTGVQGEAGCRADGCTSGVHSGSPFPAGSGAQGTSKLSPGTMSGAWKVLEGKAVNSRPSGVRWGLSHLKVWPSLGHQQQELGPFLLPFSPKSLELQNFPVNHPDSETTTKSPFPQTRGVWGLPLPPGPAV